MFFQEASVYSNNGFIAFAEAEVEHGSFAYLFAGVCGRRVLGVPRYCGAWAAIALGNTTTNTRTR
jgi:hypothetical protein